MNSLVLYNLVTLCYTIRLLSYESQLTYNQLYKREIKTIIYNYNIFYVHTLTSVQYTLHSLFFYFLRLEIPLLTSISSSSCLFVRFTLSIVNCSSSVQPNSIRELTVLLLLREELVSEIRRQGKSNPSCVAFSLLLLSEVLLFETVDMMEILEQSTHLSVFCVSEQTDSCCLQLSV